MKKILSIALFLSVTVAFAQNFSEGDKVANFGLGVAGASYKPVGKSTIPPIQASVEYFVKDNISVGGFLGYTSYKESGGFSSPSFGGFDSRFEVKSSYILLGALGNYHFYDEDKLNAYGGLSLGYALANSSVTYSDPSFPTIAVKTGGSSFIYGLQVGGRYFFTDKLAANVELGYGVSVLKIGVSYKL